MTAAVAYRIVVPLSLAVGLVGCTDPVAPHPVLTLTVVKGTSDQTAPAGFPLPQSLAVRVTADGHPKADVTVTWAASAGSLERGTSMTGPDGIASTTWTLGPTSGVQTATATVVDASGSASAFFIAHAVDLDPHELLGIAIDSVAQPLHPGDVVQLTVRTFTRDRLPYDAPVTWTSLDPSVATVSADGVLTAVAGGTATISAYMEDARGALSVTVVEP